MKRYVNNGNDKLSFKDFKEEVYNGFYAYVLDEFMTNGGCDPIFSGQELDDESDANSWYYCCDYFHDDTGYVPLSEVDIEEVFDECETTFSENHNDNPYFSDYAGYSIDDFDPQIIDALRQYYDDETINSYAKDNDLSWLLDGYAFKKVFPIVFAELQNG